MKIKTWIPAFWEIDPDRGVWVSTKEALEDPQKRAIMLRQVDEELKTLREREKELWNLKKLAERLE